MSQPARQQIETRRTLPATLVTGSDRGRSKGVLQHEHSPKTPENGGDVGELQGEQGQRAHAPSEPQGAALPLATVAPQTIKI